MNDDKLIQVLSRIADSLERIAPQSSTKSDLNGADAFVWHVERYWLEPINNINRMEIELLKGIDHQQNILWENTKRLRPVFPPKMRCCGALEARAKVLLSKLYMRPSRRKTPQSLAR